MLLPGLQEALGRRRPALQRPGSRRGGAPRSAPAASMRRSPSSTRAVTSRSTVMRLLLRAATDSSKWNCPSSHWKTLKTISRTWDWTADHRSSGRERAHLDQHPPLAAAPGRARARRTRSASGVILPSRSSTSPSRSLGQVARGEDDPALLEVERLARAAGGERQDAGRRFAPAARAGGRAAAAARACPADRPARRTARGACGAGPCVIEPWILRRARACEFSGGRGRRAVKEAGAEAGTTSRSATPV